jgi:hypothetical protein
MKTLLKRIRINIFQNNHIIVIDPEQQVGNCKLHIVTALTKVIYGDRRRRLS